MGRPARGRGEVVWAARGRVPGGCGGRRGEHAVPGGESTGAGQGALIGRTVRSGRALRSSTGLKAPSPGAPEAARFGAVTFHPFGPAPFQRHLLPRGQLVLPHRPHW
jgi:hypothetical protein